MKYLLFVLVGTPLGSQERPAIARVATSSTPRRQIQGYLRRKKANENQAKPKAR